MDGSTAEASPISACSLANRSVWTNHYKNKPLKIVMFHDSGWILHSQNLQERKTSRRNYMYNCVFVHSCLIAWRISTFEHGYSVGRCALHKSTTMMKMPHAYIEDAQFASRDLETTCKIHISICQQASHSQLAMGGKLLWVLLSWDYKFDFWFLKSCWSYVQICCSLRCLWFIHKQYKVDLWHLMGK